MIAEGGVVDFGEDLSGDGWSVRAMVPPCRPQDLGDRQFCIDHGLEYPYIAGAMANGIASPELVEAMSRAGMLGVYGAAGLTPDVVGAALDRLETRLGRRPYASNLIHSPYEAELEEAIVDLYLQRGLHLVCASAYLDMTLSIVRYRVAGIHTDPEGRVVTPNRLIAKVSRSEVADKFFAPPPDEMLAELVGRGSLSESQANMARTIPVAQDLTVEADSGGHTDNRPALAQFPTMLALRDRQQDAHGFEQELRVGAAGGIATPQAAAAAFAMGAAYILTGSVNQACREAGTSDTVRELLAEVEQADVRMAPAADMFEMGVQLQVTNRRTMFPMRAQKLYDLYAAYDSLEDIPAEARAAIEKSIFRMPLDDVWRDTEAFWNQRDPQQIERANRDAHHKMALTFRWYLGQSSRWANAGVAGREMDYQVWCGPAMGSFNEWVRGSHLENWQNRRVVPIARNILRGAAVLTRAHVLASQGVNVSTACLDLAPRETAELSETVA
ncbi:MAG: PfaD family polyunsaturated fatty acid/polyketide biosynthesis protein [Planctomycetota bacterium]|nr:PfaD family polyunsaturated fatty acid/polyketide biosynthesis protein [Planctomycetota bacterium]